MVYWDQTPQSNYGYERLRKLGTYVRCREQKVEHELQPSKVFRSFESGRAKRLSFTELVLGLYSTKEHHEIVAAFENYYADLFQRKSPAIPIPTDILDIVPKEPEETRESINGPITPSEVKKAVKALSKNKSPGPDGVGSAFYKAFTGVLRPVLADVFEDIMTRKLCPHS